jgi:hypothetical protein
MRCPIDLEDALVQVPLVTRPRQPTADLIGKSLAELAASLSQRLMADHGAEEGQLSSTIRKLNGKRK